MSWRFQPGEELSGAFRRVAVEDIAKARVRLELPESDQERAIHETRRSFKRLRALLRLARPSLGSAFEWENRRWRDSGRLLSASRDAAVLLATFDAMIRRRPDLPAPDVADLRRHVGDTPPGGSGPSRADSLQQVLDALDGGERVSAELTWSHDVDGLRRGLEDSQKRLRKSWRAARETGKAEHLHEWRKCVKDQMAQLGLFRDVMHGGLRKRLAHEKKLADVLGEERDLVLLADRLARPVPTPTEETRDRLLETIAARRKSLRKRAFDIGEALSSEKPKAFARTVCESWRKAAVRSQSASKTGDAKAA
jgi:CHAD domain-containing protein